jgi:hypothetical protein
MVEPWPRSTANPNARQDKIVLTCSVENLNAPEDHDVVGEHHEHQVAAAGPVAAAGGGRTKVSFDHAYDGFDLPALAVSSSVKMRLHSSAVTPFGGFVGGAAMACGDQ